MNTAAEQNFKLTPENALVYLRERGVLGAREGGDEVRTLGGGVSNDVLFVATPERRVIVKQPLANLRVEADWGFSRRRALVERDALETVRELVGPGIAPEVLDCDEERLVITIAYVPHTSTWKEAMLAGEPSNKLAAEVGSTIGLVQARASARPDLARKFADLTILRQGRTDPYHRTIAEVHPDLAEVIGRDIERLETNRHTLVLGDLSPKNILIGGRTTLIDFETAHWGDSAFDPAFCLTHICLKAIHRPQDVTGLLASANVFHIAYTAAASGQAASPAALASELGCLLLARVDGRSPAEYLTPHERDVVRDLARSVLKEGATSPAGVFARVDAAARGLA